jgi:ABC-2 type transport system ATP-binding protein
MSEHVDVVKTADLTRRFGTIVAVDAISIEVQAGQMFGLLGSNGAGKTTAIKMLTTLLPPTSGTATVAGIDICREASNIRRAIDHAPQMISADGNLTGYENLLIFVKLYDSCGFEKPAEAVPELMEVYLAPATAAKPEAGEPTAAKAPARVAKVRVAKARAAKQKRIPRRRAG